MLIKTHFCFEQLQIWDTTGQERFQSMMPGYYRQAHGCLVVYDITDRRTLTNAMKWGSEVQKYSCIDTVHLLVGR